MQKYLKMINRNGKYLIALLSKRFLWGLCFKPFLLGRNERGKKSGEEGGEEKCAARTCGSFGDRDQFSPEFLFKVQLQHLDDIGHHAPYLVCEELIVPEELVVGFAVEL